MKVLEWSQHFSHYKSMGIFVDAQGQKNPQSVVGYGRFQTCLRFYGCPCLILARMKKIPSKMKALERSQHFPHYNPLGAICC